MNKPTFFDMCSGIGGGRLGLELSGYMPVGFADTSRLSVTTYKILFDIENDKNWGNLKRIKCSQLPSFDVLIAGFPCQTFSVIGRREGFLDDRGQIIFHLARIIEETQPKAFILENVKGLTTHNKGVTLEIILELLKSKGYYIKHKVLNSLDFGVPQMRQRVYFVGLRKDLNKCEQFEWPTPRVEVPNLLRFLIDKIPISQQHLDILPFYLNNSVNNGKYTISDLLSMEGMVIDTRMSDIRFYEGRVPTLRSQRDGLLYVFEHNLYALSGFEALLLQGFPREYAGKVKNIVSNRHLLMQAGNAMTVNVIFEIGNQLKKLL